ncbi:MAG: HdeD family acid-resistance protein [Pseudomonadota bacterium]
MSQHDQTYDTQDGNDDQQTPSAAYDAGRRASTNQWVLYALGIVSILGGVIAIAMPLLSTLTAALVAGAALVASGLIGLFTAFRRHEGWHIAAAFALALLSIVVGLMIILQPVAGIFALTTLVIAWFAASGFLRIWYGFKSFGHGGAWMVALGIISVLLAVMLWFGLPFSATWVLGVLLGVDLAVWGALMIALAVRIGRAEPEMA